ncbi:MAG: DUF547 domain-containing protein [Crocinitomicaceae bacterium]
MRFSICFILLFFLTESFYAQVDNRAEQLSIDFFYAVMNNATSEAEGLSNELAQLDPIALNRELNSDEKNLAFWINIYNSNIQHVLKKNPKLFEDRGSFFKAKLFIIAGEVLSFDIVEHGILRRSKSKLSLGYFGKFWVSKFERQMRIRTLDPRIHYALNCGALSCPSIVPYHTENIDNELDKSVSTYLKKYCVIENDKVKVPVLFSWFRADFGGKKGILKFLVQYGILTKVNLDKELEFLPYDWTLALKPYN